MAKVSINNLKNKKKEDFFKKNSNIVINEEQEKRKKQSYHKFLGYNIANELIKANPESALIKQYKNTKFCVDTFYLHKVSNSLGVEEVKKSTSYCKNRTCPVCNRIRTAILYNSYEEQLKQLKDPHFVTLTIPNEKDGEKLKGTLKEMLKAFREIKDNFRKQFKSKLNGLRKLEITINENEKSFHPHYHIIIDGEREAKYILENWLKKFKNAERQAQDIEKINFEDGKAIKEMFKYFTKFFTYEYEKDERGNYIYTYVERKGHITRQRKKLKDQNGKDILKLPNLKMLNTILEVLSGLRVYQPFGDMMKKHEKQSEDFSEEDITADTYKEELKENEIKVYRYKIKFTDWIAEETGELWSGFEPSESTKKLFDKKSKKKFDT